MNSTTASPPTRCGQSGCSVATTGQCLEGLSPKSCPHHIEIVVEDVSATTGNTSSLLTERVQLRSGLELSLEEAGNLLASQYSRVIAIVGDADAGKTTLLGSLFDQFSAGVFGGYEFGGSQSLCAFDRRVYLGHTRCGADGPDTVRTSHASDIKFLHLRLRPTLLSEPAREVLISDIPGETCRRARHSVVDCQLLRPLMRADRLIVTVDGQKLADAKLRESTSSEAATLLRRLVETPVLRKGIAIDMVVTKWDLVLRANADVAVRDTMLRTRSRISGAPYFSGRSLSVFEVAARPESTDLLPHCFGMERIPKDWCESARPQHHRTDDTSDAERDMDKFLPSIMPEEGSA